LGVTLSPEEDAPVQNRWMIAAGGVSFVTAAVTFVSVFTYLALNFDYPAILDGSASEVLPRLLSGGTLMRATWALYAFLPLLLVPGAVGTYLACPASRGRMTLALLAACLGAMAMCLGLVRWPSIHWALAEADNQSGQEVRSSLAAVFTGLNLYLGNYIGEFLGELCLAAFFLLSSSSLLSEGRFARWLGWCGIAFAFLFLVGAFRNFFPLVQPVADVNNVLLPLWMVMLGVSLIWSSRNAKTQSDAQQALAAAAPLAARR
jgi:Domain of unknown function (DUF4386)